MHSVELKLKFSNRPLVLPAETGSASSFSRIYIFFSLLWIMVFALLLVI